ncbi:MAG: PDZ domain-containing protein [Hyphomicrobiales bacterium]|nr:PDZ domain-containing protein [Hyphomicrobiales bacterium]
MTISPGIAAVGVAALLLAGSVGFAETASRSNDPVFDRSVALVERHFYDPDGLEAFHDAVGLVLASLPDLAEADSAVRDDAIDFVLESLDSSHVGHFTPDQVDYFELVDVFRFGLRDNMRRLFPPRGRVTYVGIGVASTAIDGRVFVTDVYDGGPADRAGLMVGDEVLLVDDVPFAEVGSFRGKAGKTAVVNVRRAPGEMPIDIAVQVEALSPGDSLVSAIEESVELVEHNGYAIGYMRLWAYTDRRVRGVIEESLAGPLAGADALILDLRSRWGGAPPDAANSFVGGAPDMTMIGRDGETSIVHSRWRKPIVAIIDEGTRSGMEVLAHALRMNDITLLGTPTAADVVAGRAYLLPDDSLLEVAVADVFVDGARLEGVGVEPDIFVPFKVPYAAGADPQLAAALDQVTRELASRPIRPTTP